MSTNQPKTRAEKRRENYTLLRTLGYSANESRQLRDVGPPKREERFDTDTRQIRQTPARQRTEPQRKLLSEITQFRRERRRSQRITRERLSIAERKTERLQRFRQWSASRNFPPQHEALIIEYNRSHGHDINSSIGYRWFYHRFVNGFSDIESERQIEQNDT